MAVYTIESGKKLRELIEKTLGDSIGTLTFENGLSTAAIAVLNGGEQYPPPNSKITGLEIVIFAPEMAIGDLLGGYICENQWVVHVKQWDFNRNTNEAVKKLLTVLGNVKKLMKVPPSKQLNIPEMVRIVVNDFESILLK